ncbi:MAG: hypothetical protein ACLUGG_07680, partial [Oscillospiraceae bacterium]
QGVASQGDHDLFHGFVSFFFCFAVSYGPIAIAVQLWVAAYIASSYAAGSRLMLWGSCLNQPGMIAALATEVAKAAKFLF